MEVDNIGLSRVKNNKNKENYVYELNIDGNVKTMSKLRAENMANSIRDVLNCSSMHDRICGFNAVPFGHIVTSRENCYSVYRVCKEFKLVKPKNR